MATVSQVRSRLALGAGGWGNEYAWMLAVAGLWLWTFHQLALTWSANPSYAYGYAVPWIALYLAWRRLRAAETAFDLPGAGSSHPWAAALGLTVAWGSFLLAQLLAQRQPPSRLLGWLMALAATLLTGVWLFRRGGGKLLHTLAFPLAFTWLGVEWPARFESALTLQLKALVTAATVAALNATGIFALQRGNVIELASSAVGVETACSGVTSLQSSLMVTLFLGEFFRFSFPRRVFLLATGSLIALGANAARVYTLSLLMEAGGHDALARYHDLLGLLEALGILLLIWGAVYWMAAGARPQSTASGEEVARVSGLLPAARLGYCGYVTLLAFAAPPALAVGWVSFLRGRSESLEERPQWVIHREVAPPWQLQPVTLSTPERQVLGFTFGEGYSIGGSASGRSTLYHFFWKSDAPTLAPQRHTPDICMTLAGWVQKGPSQTVNLSVDGRHFGARYFRFERNGAELVAFETVWYGGEVTNELTRFGMIWKSPRGYGAEVLGLFMPVLRDREAQIRAAETTLAQVLRWNPPAAKGLPP